MLNICLKVLLNYVNYYKKEKSRSYLLIDDEYIRATQQSQTTAPTTLPIFNRRLRKHVNYFLVESKHYGSLVQTSI